VVLAVTAMSSLIAILVAEAAAVGAPHTGLEGEPVAGAIAEAEATQTATSPVVVWTSLGPLPRWVPGPTTRWAPGTTRLVPHGT
jgi:hypothetical protein